MCRLRIDALARLPSGWRDPTLRRLDTQRQPSDIFQPRMALGWYFPKILALLYARQSRCRNDAALSLTCITDNLFPWPC